ncbi:putative CCR4-NOT complex subunit/5 domain superfamily protein [Helianthus anomalus]
MTVVCRYNRCWFYHQENHLWFMRPANMEPLVKTYAYERGSYICFDPNTWERIHKVDLFIPLLIHFLEIWGGWVTGRDPHSFWSKL